MKFSSLFEVRMSPNITLEQDDIQLKQKMKDINKYGTQGM